VIYGDLAERLPRDRTLRNLLVHQVDPERLWEALGELEDLEAFVAGWSGTLDHRE
jgi:uncharacterized protein YutE (UPF0331/DUF86 family)